MTVSVWVLGAGASEADNVGVTGGGNKSKSILTVCPRSGFCTHAVPNASASGLSLSQLPISSEMDFTLTMSQRLGIRHLSQTCGAIVKRALDAWPVTIQILQGGIGLQEPIGQG